MKRSVAQSRANYMRLKFAGSVARTSTFKNAQRWINLMATDLTDHAGAPSRAGGEEGR